MQPKVLLPTVFLAGGLAGYAGFPYVKEYMYPRVEQVPNSIAYEDQDPTASPAATVLPSAPSPSPASEAETEPSESPGPSPKASSRTGKPNREKLEAQSSVSPSVDEGGESGIASQGDIFVAKATVETVPVSHDRDAIDDPAIDPFTGIIIGTDKAGALEVYDIATGERIQSIPYDTNNVDLRHNFPLGEEKITLVMASSPEKMGLVAFKIDTETRKLVEIPITGDTIESKMSEVGIGMYRSIKTGKYYVFSNIDNVLSQYEIVGNENGEVILKLVRTVEFDSKKDKTEGVVADDVNGKVYVSEEAVGIWELSAEPDGGEEKIAIDKTVSQGGHIVPDIEGLTIYPTKDGGYLIGSVQGSNTYNVYRLNAPEGEDPFIGSFRIGDGEIDGTSETDGIDVTNLPVGPFKQGVFFAQDGSDDKKGGKRVQNFKGVPWEQIAKGLSLEIDTTLDTSTIGQH